MMSIIRPSSSNLSFFFFFNDTATTEIYTLSLHDALPIFRARCRRAATLPVRSEDRRFSDLPDLRCVSRCYHGGRRWTLEDRKSTRLNSSHLVISYAVFCLNKKIHRSDRIYCAVIALSASY